MQYHLNGFEPGDPKITNSGNRRGQVKDGGKLDILIIGCGPAGLTLAAQLSAFPEISTGIIEQKNGPLEVGQADGIACRSMEMFEAFGFVEKVMRESYWVNETTFWRPSSLDGKLSRADRIQDVEDGLSEFPHTILSQARIHDFYLEFMRTSPCGLVPEYGHRLLSISNSNDPDYPHLVRIECTEENGKPAQKKVRARYVVGCDGARSAVRNSMGLELKGASARQLWGVMDILARTDFPDIRLKCAIQSASHGSLLLIPREGGYLVRMYIELDELKEGERAANRNVSPEQLIDKAKTILAPYSLEVAEVAWWSAYEIGQRLCDRFDNVSGLPEAQHLPDVFIVGDACHTHSPKAGQGMNISMADSFNLGWKLASVVRKQAKPSLLSTYSQERQSKASELIEFDRDMARLFSAKAEDDQTARQFQQYFAKHARYTAGVETRYEPSLITGPATHQSLAGGFTIGMRFHSAPVIRLADAKPLHLAHTLKADGRWRIMLFAGSEDRGTPGSNIEKLCGWLEREVLSSLTPSTTGVKDDTKEHDSVIDVRAVFQVYHRELAIEKMPRLLLPSKGRFGLTDYEKIFCAAQAPDPDIFDLRSIDREKGAMVIIRPDQYVAHVLPLQPAPELVNFFAGFMLPPVVA